VSNVNFDSRVATLFETSGMELLTRSQGQIFSNTKRLFNIDSH
jgi:hypothetical protein